MPAHLHCSICKKEETSYCAWKICEGCNCKARQVALDAFRILNPPIQPSDECYHCEACELCGELAPVGILLVCLHCKEEVLKSAFYGEHSTMVLQK